MEAGPVALVAETFSGYCVGSGIVNQGTDMSGGVKRWFLRSLVIIWFLERP